MNKIYSFSLSKKKKKMQSELIYLFILNIQTAFIYPKSSVFSFLASNNLLNTLHSEDASLASQTHKLAD